MSEAGYSRAMGSPQDDRSPLTARPGTIVVFTDVMCGWSTLALHRFYRARAEAGLDEKVRVDPQLYLLEDINRTPLNPG